MPYAHQQPFYEDVEASTYSLSRIVNEYMESSFNYKEAYASLRLSKVREYRMQNQKSE